MHAYHLSQWLIFFFIYSFIGWVWESCYVSVRKRHWVNRGFLHGPMLPIYGSGAVVILVSTIGVREHPWLIFIFGLVAATALEYVTGAVMERMFHVRYWDYSHQRFQVKGYICLRSSIAWGFFSILLVRVLHPPLEDAVLALPTLAAQILSLGLTVCFGADVSASAREAFDLKELLEKFSRVTNWNEPRKVGRRVYDDKVFYESLRKQRAEGKALSDRQSAALRKLAAKYQL